MPVWHCFRRPGSFFFFFFARKIPISIFSSGSGDSMLHQSLYSTIYFLYLADQKGCVSRIGRPLAPRLSVSPTPCKSKRQACVWGSSHLVAAVLPTQENVPAGWGGQRERRAGGGAEVRDGAEWQGCVCECVPRSKARGTVRLNGVALERS